MRNFDHVVVSVSIDFPSYLQWDALFHHIAYDYSCANWDGLCDHLRDNPWEDIIKVSASAAASEFCEWVQAGIDVYIPLRNCQVKSHGFSPMVFSCLFCCHRLEKLLFLYQKGESSESKVKFRQASNCWER